MKEAASPLHVTTLLSKLKKYMHWYIIVLAVLFLLFASMNNAWLIPVFHSDGAFQTASSVTRILLGELPGRDFLTYLGIGLNYVVTFFAFLFGGSLTDVVAASYFVTYLSIWVIFLVILICVYPSGNYLKLLSISGFLAIMSIAVNLRLNIPILAFMKVPGNSLLTLRSILPFLLILLSHRIVLKTLFSTRDVFLLGLIAGVGALWSNDYAYTSTFLFSVLFLVCLMLKNRNGKLRLIVIYSMTALLSALAYYTLATGGYPLNMLEYNFIDVRPDQWWYFVPYSADARIASVDDLLSKLTDVKIVWAPFLFAFLFILGVAKKQTKLLILASLGGSVYLSGILTSTGGHYSFRYFFPTVYYTVALLACASLSLAYIVIKNVFNSRRIKIIHVSLLMLAGIFSTYISAKQCFSYVSHKQHYAQNNEKFFYYAPLEGYCTTAWKPYLDFIEQNRKSTVLEEYWGIWSSVVSQEKIQRVDACIHALGREREPYISLIDSSDFVITSVSTMGVFQNWRLSTNYEFYRKLLQSWTPVFKSPNTIVWGRSNESSIGEEVNALITRGGQAIRIPCTEPSFFDVEIKVKSVYESRGLFLIRNNICDIDIPNYVSLNPYKDRHFIIVYATPDSCEFDLKKIAGAKNSIEIVDVNARQIINLEPDVYIKDSINIKDVK